MSNQESKFILGEGCFGINLTKIIKVEKHPEEGYALFVYFDDSGIPCFQLRHKSRQFMELSYENIINLQRGQECKIIDFTKFKKGRK